MTAWMLARASGFTAYIAFAIAMMGGLMLSSKYMGKRSGRALTLVHEAASIAGVLLVFVHAWAILNDAFFNFTLKALLLPGLSPYAPLWVGVGIVAAYLSVVVVLSFYVRKQIGPRLWRRFHYVTFVAFIAMTVHGIMAGSDSSNIAAIGLYSGVSVVVLVLIGYRVVTSISERKVKAARKAAAVARAAAKKKNEGPARGPSSESSVLVPQS